jgi:hypothetical protein
MAKRKKKASKRCIISMGSAEHDACPGCGKKSLRFGLEIRHEVMIHGTLDYAVALWRCPLCKDRGEIQLSGDVVAAAVQRSFLAPAPKAPEPEKPPRIFHGLPREESVAAKHEAAVEAVRQASWIFGLLPAEVPGIGSVVWKITSDGGENHFFGRVNRQLRYVVIEFDPEGTGYRIRNFQTDKTIAILPSPSLSAGQVLSAILETEKKESS